MQTKNIHPAARYILDEAFLVFKERTAASINDLTDRLSDRIATCREFNNVWSGMLTPDEQLKMFGVHLQLFVDPTYITIRKVDGAIQVQVVHPSTLDFRRFSVRDIVTMSELEAEAEGHRAVMQSERSHNFSSQYLDDSARLFDFAWKAEDPVAYANWEKHCVASRSELEVIRQRNDYHYSAWKRCQRDLEQYRELLPFSKPVVVS